MNRQVVLVAIALGLGILTWHDYSGQDDGQPVVKAAPQSVDLAEGRQMARDNPAQRTTQIQISEEQAADNGLETNRDNNAAPIAETANPLAFLDKSQLTQIVERPLFAPSRRRPPPRENKPGKEKVGYKGFEFLGIARTNNQEIVLLRRLADGFNFRLQVGDVIGDSQLARIDDEAIILTKADGTSERIRLGRK